MKIFITGILGFIGSNLAERFISLGWEVSGCDDLSFGSEENRIDGVNYLIMSAGEVGRQHLVGYDVVILSHCVNIMAAEDSPFKTYESNVGDSINVVNKVWGNSLVINLSTASVYGMADKFPTPESAAIRCTNDYAQSKYLFERFLLDKPHVKWVNLRLSNVYGRRQRPESPYSGVIGKLLGAKLNDTGFFIYGDGLQTRDYTYIDDVLDVIENICLNYPSLICIHGTFNIGTGVETNINELVEYVSPRYINNVEPRKIDNITRRRMDIRLAEDWLKYSVKFSVEEGIERTIKYLIDNRKS